MKPGYREVAFVLAAFLVAPPAPAGDGRIEISQSSILAAGGFPFQIRSQGSYVLTGDVAVPPGKTGIQIAAPEVTLDLNGFGIRGPHQCGSSGCGTSSTVGVEATAAGSELARHTTLRNGVVSGFGANCVDLGPGARVEGLVVRSCGGSGIRAAEHSRVEDNRVSDCGAWGISFLAAASYGENILSNVNRLGGAGFIAGGTSSGANICDTGRCPSDRPGRKRYYLTAGSFPGNHGGNVCAVGFRMASVFELMDRSDLDYDATLGFAVNGGGPGPPASSLRAGWAHTGMAADSCETPSGPWTSNSPSQNGLIARFENGVFGSPNSPGLGSFPSSTSCDNSWPAWCVED